MEGDDADYLGMLDRDVAALRTAAGEIESLLASLDIGAGLASSLSGGDLASINTDELAQGLGEQMAGIGTALAEDLGTELGQGLAAAGVEGGQTLAEGVAEGASSLGDGIASDLDEKLAEPVRSAGADAGAALQEGFVSGVSGLGAQIDHHVSADLGSLQGSAGAAGAAAGAALTSGIQGGLSSLSARAAAAAAELAVSMTAAGAAGGDALAAGISAGATSGAGRTAQHVADAVQAGLDTSLAQAGMSGGDVLAAGISYGASQGADDAAQKIADVMSASLSTSMTQTGMAAGDSMAAGMAASAAKDAESVAVAYGTALDLPAEVTSQAVGAKAGEAFVAGFRGPVTDLNARFAEWQAAQNTTAWTPHISLQPFLDEIARAEAAERELAAAMAADEEIIQNGIDNFLTLSDAQLRQWMAEVESAATESSSAFIDAYFAINEQLDATTALTVQQQQAMDYLYAEARAEMDALQAEAIAFNNTIRGLEGFTPKSMVTGDTFYTADQMSQMVAGFRNGATEAEGLGSELKAVGATAGEAGGSLGGMASVMSGPWGMAIFAGLSLLPELGSAFKGLAGAMDPTKAQLLDVQQLQQAIGGDGGTAGLTTAAFVATSSAANGMADSAKQAGVSLETWTEAAMGNSDAQAAVTASVEKLNQAQDNQAAAAARSSGANSHAAQDLKGAEVASADAAAATNQLTDANQKLLNSMNAEAAQVAKTVAAQRQQDEVTMQLALNQQIFSATLDGAYTKMQLQTQAASEATVALLNLGDNQFSANMQLYNSVNAYSQAQQGANSYNTVLQSLNGSFNTLYGDEAGFTGALANLTSSLDHNGKSLDANSAKGYQNAQAAKAVADAAIQTSVAVYENDVANGNATGAYQDASAKLAQEKQAFEDAAIKAGANKDAVKALADELFTLPPSITVDANINPALKSLNALLAAVDNSIGTVRINGQSGVGNLHGDIASARAAGGPVQAGVEYTVGEQGIEKFTPATDGYITAHSALGSDYGGGRVTVVHNHYHVEGSLIHQDDLRETVQQGTLRFQQRNSYTGMQYA